MKVSTSTSMAPGRTSCCGAWTGSPTLNKERSDERFAEECRTVSLPQGGALRPAGLGRLPGAVRRGRGIPHPPMGLRARLYEGPQAGNALAQLVMRVAKVLILSS